MQPTPNPRQPQLELFRPSIQIPQWDSYVIGLAAKDDPVAITIVPSVSGKPTRPPGEGGRR